MQIKTKMGCHFTCTRIAKKIKKTIVSVDKDVVKLEPVYIIRGIVN